MLLGSCIGIQYDTILCSSHLHDNKFFSFPVSNRHRAEADKSGVRIQKGFYVREPKAKSGLIPRAVYQCTRIYKILAQLLSNGYRAGRDTWGNLDWHIVLCTRLHQDFQCEHASNVHEFRQPINRSLVCDCRNRAGGFAWRWKTIQQIAKPFRLLIMYCLPMPCENHQKPHVSME